MNDFLYTNVSLKNAPKPYVSLDLFNLYSLIRGENKL